MEDFIADRLLRPVSANSVVLFTVWDTSFMVETNACEVAEISLVEAAISVLVEPKFFTVCSCCLVVALSSVAVETTCTLEYKVAEFFHHGSDGEE